MLNFKYFLLILVNYVKRMKEKLKKNCLTGKKFFCVKFRP